MTGQPVLLAVDDNPDVLRAVEQDLDARYGTKFQVLAARSGSEALLKLHHVQEQGDVVALVLADHRMPRMNGRELLAAVPPLAPSARRLLLTLPEDTETALQAITAREADDYLLKPWEQPELRAFPLLDDLLLEWRAGARQTADGIQVIGSRWSPAAHQVRDFLSRNLVPYRWVDVETALGRRMADRAAPGETHQVMVVFPDGSTLPEPELSELAEKVGLQTRTEQRFYDLLIVGGGPAGLAAAVYAASEGLRAALIESEAPGGQAGMSARIENYLGFPAGLSGGDLTRRAVAQARRFGAEILSTKSVTGISFQDRYRTLTLSDGSTVSAYSLVIASGVTYRTLDAPGSERLNGAGIYYGSAMTQAFFCRDEDVYIVGGANSAGQAAVYLAGFARSVTILVRGPSLSASMSRYLIDQIGQIPNVHVRTRTRVVEVHGETHLEAITVKDETSESTEKLPAASLFVFIGASPQTDWLSDCLERDEKGFIVTGPDLIREGDGQRWREAREPYLLETSVPGIFAAGDARHGSMKRVASAVGEGAMAVSFVHQYLAQE